MEIVFQFLRYWGLHHNWDMHIDASVFDGRRGVKAYLRKLKVNTIMAILFIGASGNSFLSGVFVLLVDNLECSITHVVSGSPYSIVTPIIDSVFHTRLLI